jgi:hypothetical protein
MKGPVVGNSVVGQGGASGIAVDTSAVTVGGIGGNNVPGSDS